ncbi:MAG: trypsin-like peptidase domain-containing protein [Clostridia bacterium]|nr:trypsin-like peptidase domain-containing protein [Clostridia bacterium]
MDQNFEQNTNNAGQENTPVTPNPQTSGQYRPPVNTQYNSYYGNGQYMPYGSYGYAQQKPEATKTKSKGKKKGLVIAIAIVAICFVVAFVFLVSSLFVGGNKPQNNGDDTQMNLIEGVINNQENTSEDGILTAKQVYKKVHESSVGILVYSSGKQNVVSEGTGIVMGTNSDNTATYIITCAHVIDAKNPKITVQTADGSRYDGFVVGADAKTDIGVVRVNSTKLKAAEFADSSVVEVGDTVYAIGNPGGTQFFGSFTNGMVSAIGRPVNSPVGYEVACIQHTAPINPGNSGGALVNEYGQVIGINSSKIASTDYEGMGFAVPSATVKEIVDELIKNGVVTNRPVLGVKVADSSYSQTYSIVVKANKLPVGSVVIDTIMIGSDLENKGVKEGDMIIKVNGKDMESQDVLLEAIENKKVGDVLTLTICRVDSNYNISTFDVDVKLVDDSTVSEPQTEVPEYDYGFSFPFGE